MTGSKSHLRSTIALLNRAVAWWFNEIREIARLPGRLRKTAKLEFEAAHNQAPRLISDNKRITAGTSKHIRLRFSDNALLYRKVKLPAAATRSLDSVIRYEFNRYFPMNAEDALYSFCILPSPLRNESVEVEIWAISRTSIDNILIDIKSTYNIHVKTLVVANENKRDVLYYDIASARKADISPATLRRHRQLNVVLVLLFVAVILYPLYKTDLHIDELEAQVSLLKQDARPIQNMRDQIRNRQAQLDNLINIKQQSSEQTYIWSRITESLNGKAVLNRMSISGNEVQLEGKAPSVEQLIKMLEANPDISNVVIIGPVEPAEGGKYETMKIALTVL